MKTWFPLLLLPFALSIFAIQSDDLFMYFNLAKYYFQNGSLPTHDVFSYAYPDSALHTMHQWLTYFVYYGFWNMGDLIANLFGASANQTISIASVILLKAAIVTATAALALNGFLTVQKSRHQIKFPPIAYLLFALATYAASFRFIERGSLFSDLFAIFLIFYLVNQTQITKKLIITLTFLFLLWIQLHPAYPIGLLFLFAWTIYNFSANKDFRNLKILALGISVLALLLNPEGLRGVLYPFEFAIESAPVFKQFNLEWMPTFDRVYWKAPEVICFYLLAALSILSFVIKRPKFSVDTVFWVLSIVLGFYAMRFTLWSSFAIFGLSARWTVFPQIKIQSTRFHKVVNGILAAVSVAVLIFGYPSSSGKRLAQITLDPKFYPEQKTIEFLKQHQIPGQLYSAHQMSHYLIWSGIQPIYHHGFSTYMPLYRDELMQLEKNQNAFTNLVLKYNWTKFFVDKAASYKVFYNYMLSDPHWQIVAEDDASYLIYYLPEAKQ
jgi:hypothetical protein